MIDDLTKRLMSLMQLDAWLTGSDGHIWIESAPDGDDNSLDKILYDNDIALNGKIYGGILQALDTIDAALQMCGELTLLERYSESVQFLGEPGVARSRIDKSKRGGIY